MKTQAAVKLDEDKYVSELFSLLKTNGRHSEASDLTSIIGYMALMERQLGSMEAELRNVSRELATMREERDHPAREMYQRMAKALTTRIAAARKWLNAAKVGIVEGAKNAVDKVKQAGITALDATMDFLKVKDNLIYIRDSMAKAARSAGKTVEKIETVSEEYHAVGTQVRNWGRAIAGKEQRNDILPNGILAKVSQSMFKNAQGVLNGIARDADKAIGCLEKLEEKAKTRSGQEKQSVMENLQTLQADVANTPAPVQSTKAKTEVSL